MSTKIVSFEEFVEAGEYAGYDSLTPDIFRDALDFCWEECEEEFKEYLYRKYVERNTEEDE